MITSKKTKLLLLGFWLCVFIFVAYLWWQSRIPFTQLPMILRDSLTEFGLLNAALIYIAAYTLRLIIFFPATLLSLISGYVFGPWLGILITTIAANISANVGFVIARYFGRDIVASAETGLLKKWDARIRRNATVSVMIMRFLYLPFDGINFGCGLTSMRQRDFAIGTFIGILPGLITFVLVAGTLSPQSTGVINLLGFEISQKIFVAVLSLFFFVIGFVISHMIKRHVHVPETT